MHIKYLTSTKLNMKICIYEACTAGFKDIANYVINIKCRSDFATKSTTDIINSGLYAACRSGRDELIVAMIRKGATDLYGAMTLCTKKSSVILIQKILGNKSCFYHSTTTPPRRPRNQSSHNDAS